MKTRAKKPSDKPTTSAFEFRTQGSVTVICPEYKHPFHLYNTLNGNKVTCPFCQAQGEVPADVIKFHEMCAQ